MHAEPNTFLDALNQVPRPDLAPLVVIAIACASALIIGIALIVSKTIYRMHKNRLDDTLKRELVDRGFSADEIVEIIGASATPEDLQSKRRGCNKRKEMHHVHA